MKRKILFILVVLLIQGVMAHSTQAAWLKGWDKRVKLTVDNAEIDSDLSNFPLLVHVSTLSGRNLEDVSFIFDELGEESNRTKIAITKADGISQCYVEIDRWDHAGEKAWLWVNVSGASSISSTTDTCLYLYYDSGHIDNKGWVGDAGSTVAENVWDSDFKGVWHLGESTGSAIDSSGTGNDASAVGDGVIRGTDEYIGKSVSLAGSADYLQKTTPASMGMTSDITVEMWLNPDNIMATAWDFYLGRTNGASWNDGWGFWSNKDNTMHWYAGVYNVDASTAHVTNWTYWAGVYDPSQANEIILYKNGAFAADQDQDGGYTASTESFTIGSSGNASYDLEGRIDEVRVSSIVRSAAWIKASYESGKDDLIDFGAEELRTELQYTELKSVRLYGVEVK